MDDERAIELYARTRELRKGLDGHSTFAMFVSLPKPLPLMDERESFLTTAQQDLQDLANFVNEFTLNTNALAAWAMVIPTLEHRELLPVTMEFVNPLGYFCLGVPYALKGRLCKSIAHVSHLANEFTNADWEHVPELGKSSVEKAQEHANGWAAWASLRDRIGQLDNKLFRNAVAGFRNEFHHGSPRMFEIGAKPFVDRRGSGVVVGEVPPLRLEDVVAALAPQQAASVSAYNAYVGLVQEQCDAVMANKRINPSASR